MDKAALLAGFGRANVRVVATDAAYAMRPDALDEAIRADLAAGRTPCAVVATTGTTTTTALDPIGAIAEVARRHGLWLHVDAALAGSAMILPECRPLWDGIEEADSLVLNPHKWLGVAFDCSLYYVRDPQHLVRVMSTNPSYLRSGVDEKVKNLRDWGIPLGRRFRALKLWCLIREQGVCGLQARLRRDIENAKWLAAEVEKAAAVARARAGPAADRVRPPRAARPGGRGPRPAHPRLGGPHQPLGRRLPDPGDARRALDGAGQRRRASHRAPGRRGAVGGDAARGRGYEPTVTVVVSSAERPSFETLTFTS